MPGLVRRELEDLFQDEFQDVEESVRPRVAEIVTSLQPRLLELFKQQSSSRTEPGSTEPNETPSLGSGSTPATDPSTGDDLASSASQLFDFGDLDWSTPDPDALGVDFSGAYTDFTWNGEMDSLLAQPIFPSEPYVNQQFADVEPVPNL